MRYTPYGGAEVFISRLIDELISRGNDCHIYANRWSGEDKPHLFFHRVPVIGWPSFLRALSFAINSFRLLKRADMDVILSFERTFYQDIYRAGDGCHREWLLKRRTVISFFRYILVCINPFHLTLLRLEKMLFNSGGLKAVISNSERGKEEIVRHYGLLESKIHVIYNGINFKYFDLSHRKRIREDLRKRLGILSSETALVFVGSGFERKGLKVLVNAVGCMIKDNGFSVKLIVIGKGKRKYKRLSKRLGLEDNILFTGPVDDVRDYYFCGDIFVLPSLYEPFSNACLEAMACGLPVVTSRVNGVSEVITHGEDGYILDDPKDVLEIVKAVDLLLNEERRKNMGEKARDTAMKYPIEKNVDKTLSLICKEVIN